MTKFTFLYLLLLAHIIGDFTLQSSKIVKSKSNYGRGFFYHILIVSLSYFIITFPYASLKWIYAMVIILFTHTIIDYCKIKIGRSYKTTNISNAIALIIDQILHFSFMLLAFYLFRPWVYGEIGVKLSRIFFNTAQITGFTPDKLIFLSACYLFLTRGGTVFVKTISGRYKNGIESKNRNKIFNGVVVGEIERITLFTLFILQMYIFVVLVIVIKIVAQYYAVAKEERDFKGTFYSFILAIGVGFIYNGIFIW